MNSAWLSLASNMYVLDTSEISKTPSHKTPILVPFLLHFRLDLSPGIVLSVLLVVVSKAHAVYGAVYSAVAGYVNLI